MGHACQQLAWQSKGSPTWISTDNIQRLCCATILTTVLRSMLCTVVVFLVVVFPLGNAAQAVAKEPSLSSGQVKIRQSTSMWPNQVMPME